MKEPKPYIKTSRKSTVRAHKPLTEEFVKASIIKWLTRNGWGTNIEFGSLQTHGVDIKVRHNKYSRYFYVETKGGKYNEVGFVYSLGLIITRMRDGGSTINYYALGLAEASAKIALRRLPWQVAKKLLLYIFSVDMNGNVTIY